MDENKKITADAVFNLLCTVIENKKLAFSKDEEKKTLYVKIPLETEEDILFIVDEKLEIVRAFGLTTALFPTAKSLEAAIAACVAANSLRDGNFDFDLSCGSVMFRMAVSYKTNELGIESIEYLVDNTIETMKKHNDNFNELSKGEISLEEFKAKY